MIMALLHRLAIVSGLLGMAACTATPPPVAGGTTADPVLQRDVTRMIMMFDGAVDKTCSQRRIVNTEVTEQRADGSTAAERWTLDRCGVPQNYRVTYQPSPRGGTMFSVGRE
jgi:hypothetical protein